MKACLAVICLLSFMCFAGCQKKAEPAQPPRADQAADANHDDTSAPLGSTQIGADCEDSRDCFAPQVCCLGKCLTADTPCLSHIGFVGLPDEWKVLPLEQTPSGFLGVLVHAPTGAVVAFYIDPQPPIAVVSKTRACHAATERIRVSGLSFGDVGSDVSYTVRISGKKRVFDGKVAARQLDTLHPHSLVALGVWPAAAPGFPIYFDALVHDAVIK